MRTFSALRDKCAHPELIQLVTPRSYALDKAANKGTEFHAIVERWVKRGLFVCDSGDKDVIEWCRKLRASGWEPPESCHAEWAVGIQPTGEVIDVEEKPPGSHEYHAIDGSELLTAGRLDLCWTEDGTLSVADIKTGKSYLGDPWQVPQLVAQVYAASRCNMLLGGATRVRVGVYYARLGMFDFGAVKPILEVVDRFSDIVRWSTMSDEPKPGGHCLDCWEAKHCSAYPETSKAA